MPESVAITVVAGVTVAICLAAVVPAVLWVRYSLRRQGQVQRECDQWRDAAANATVSARVAAAQADDEDDDSDWGGG